MVFFVHNIFRKFQTLDCIGKVYEQADGYYAAAERSIIRRRIWHAVVRLEADERISKCYAARRGDGI